VPPAAPAASKKDKKKAKKSDAGDGQAQQQEQEQGQGQGQDGQDDDPEKAAKKVRWLCKGRHGAQGERWVKRYSAEGVTGAVRAASQGRGTCGCCLPASVAGVLVQAAAA
jgi:hypothetical protein